MQIPKKLCKKKRPPLRAQRGLGLKSRNSYVNFTCIYKIAQLAFSKSL